MGVQNRQGGGGVSLGTKHSLTFSEWALSSFKNGKNIKSEKHVKTLKIGKPVKKVNNLKYKKNGTIGKP